MERSPNRRVGFTVVARLGADSIAHSDTNAPRGYSPVSREDIFVGDKPLLAVLGCGRGPDQIRTGCTLPAAQRHG